MKKKINIHRMCEKAKKAAFSLASASTKVKNDILLSGADGLIRGMSRIIKENNKDIVLARKNKISPALIDRLILDPKRIEAMAEGLRVVAELKDPVGDIMKEITRPNGLLIKKVRVPIGVIAVIYEARPNVTADAAGLAVKSGNAIILKGGKEAFYSNRAIAAIIQEAVKKHGLNPDSVTFVGRVDRDAVKEILKQDALVDMVIPRGGESLIRAVAEHSRIPVLKHYAGVCHLFADRDADIEKALKITVNAKTQRPGVCNAIETLIVDRAIARQFLPVVVSQLQNKGVEVRGCPETRAIVKGIKKAVEKDWSTEYLDLIISVKVVDGVEKAVGHINTYGTHHSDAIVTENRDTAEKFLRDVDSATVYVNASTRFTDGFEFGFGAEMGISTDKLHARGPVALEELTTYKYLIYGQGQVRE